MAVIVQELGRVVRSGENVFMVNDNVRYHGQEAPVDLILSDFAEQSGFRCGPYGCCRGVRGTPASRWGGSDDPR